MLQRLAQALDLWVISRAAARLSAELPRQPEPVLSNPEPWSPDRPWPSSPEPIHPSWAGATGFQFPSPQPSPWPETNVVRGHLYRVGRQWQSRPSTVLVHGWGGERQYRWQFPWLARCLNRRGVNAAFFELPLHGQRRPRSPGAPRDFIWPVPGYSVAAAGQALADTEALLAWLAAAGCPAVGLWGFSLGGWLAGLLACQMPQVHFAVLFCPVPRMDQAVARLPFCAPLQPLLKEGRHGLTELDLSAHQPRLNPHRLLLVAAQHDLFVPVEEIEALAQRWGHPNFWRLPHGHISALLAPLWLRRVADWIAQRAFDA